MFKENLKYFRTMQNMSQKKLAELLGVSFKTISHWEAGYSQPSLEFLVKLKKLLDVTYADLLE